VSKIICIETVERQTSQSTAHVQPMQVDSEVPATSNKRSYPLESDIEHDNPTSSGEWI
jgi:hypothetical protein